MIRLEVLKPDRVSDKWMLYSYYRSEIAKAWRTVFEADPFECEYAPLLQTCFQTNNLLCVKLYMRLSVSKNIIKESISQPSGYGIRLSGSLHMWLAVCTTAPHLTTTPSHDGPDPSMSEWGTGMCIFIVPKLCHIRFGVSLRWPQAETQIYNDYL